MLDVKFIRENPELVKAAVKNKRENVDVDAFLELDKERRRLLTEVEELKRRKNEASSKIAQMMKKGEESEGLKASMRTLSQKIKDIEAKVEEVSQKYTNFTYRFPNIPHKSVPIGAAPEANKVVRAWKSPPEFSFEPKTHIELGESLGILDFRAAAKISGTGFALYKGLGARLERALLNFMLDVHTKKHGYTEIFPPFLMLPDI